MPNAVLRFLSCEWAGSVIAAAFAFAGALTAVAIKRPYRRAALLPLGVAAILGAGSAVHLTRFARARRRYPPPGRLVDVGGYRMHVFAEGSAGANAPIVMLGGSHAAGTVMDHLHRRLRGVTRSILIDRPGTGWSDTGPFPRTTAREADEIVAALEASGERGPYVIAGYSFGGLLAANIARRRPDLVATLVLLDPTPLETIVFGPRLGSLRELRDDALWTGIARLFGYAGDLNERRRRNRTVSTTFGDNFETQLGSVLESLRAVEIGAGSQLANYSIYRELSPQGAAACGWETVVYDGDLGDMPVVLLAPGTVAEVSAVREVQSASSDEAARMTRFFERSRERYLATSSRSRRVFSPDGTTHGYVYEAPEFVADVLCDVVRTAGRDRATILDVAARGPEHAD